MLLFCYYYGLIVKHYSCYNLFKFDNLCLPDIHTGKENRVVSIILKHTVIKMNKICDCMKMIKDDMCVYFN